MSTSTTELSDAQKEAVRVTLKGRTPKVDFSSVNPNNVGTLRKLNQVLFPVKYSDKFYKDVLLPEHEEYCQLSEYLLV